MLNDLNHYVSEFQAFMQNGAGKSPGWMNDLRKSAMDSFTVQGFPTTKLEDWKYTNVLPIARAPFRYSSAPVAVSPQLISSFMMDGTEAHIAVFVNGQFSTELSRLQSIPNGVVIKSMKAAAASHDTLLKEHLSQYAQIQKNPFTALNTAFMDDGIFIHVEKNVTVEKPVHVLFISTKGNGQSVSHIRNLIVAEEAAGLNVLWHFVGEGSHTNLTNAVTEVVAREKSTVELVKLQQESDTSYHVENVHTHQHKESSVHLFSLAVGSAIARNDMSVIIDGESTECNLNGLYITSGEQLIDHHTLMHHKHPNCPSHELFKGILMDKSRAVFNGKVYVEPEAQKTDSKQTNRNLLLSDDAVVDTKPELEIFADDVKCTHGATVGGMNETHSFYLKTRGITNESARGILTVGFAAEATEKIRNATLRRAVDTIVVDHLRKKFGTGNLPDIVHGS